MKLLVVSDIHGSSYYAKKIDEIIEKEKPKGIILLGDLYYHGPRNPLTKEYNPQEVADILNKYKEKILAVKGNCDAEVDQMISNFKLEKNISLSSNGVSMYFTHGHKINIDKMPSDYKNIDLLCYGHFHESFIKEKDGVLCVNPGSISLPKGESTNSYAIIEDRTVYIKDIDGNVLEQGEIKKRKK